MEVWGRNVSRPFPKETFLGVTVFFFHYNPQPRATGYPITVSPTGKERYNFPSYLSIVIMPMKFSFLYGLILRIFPAVASIPSRSEESKNSQKSLV